jgi:lambda family phage tail tape measure protein
MAQKTNLDILERNLNNIQRMTGASALQMAKLRAEAGDLSGAVKGLASAAANSVNSLLTLKNLIVGGIIGQGFREFSRVTSMMTDLDSRLKQATGSAEEASRAFARIFDTANRTYASFESTAEIFLSNSIALKDLGYPTKQQLDLMEALTAALVVSGAKGQRAETVISAIAKAMMEGELKGRNWTTVLQQGGRVVQALADGLGVSKKQLKEMSKAGELTSDTVFTALTSQIEKLKKEADDMPATIADAMVRFNNNYQLIIKTMDEVDASSSKVVQSIDTFGKHLVDVAAAADVAFTTIVGGITVLATYFTTAAHSVAALAKAFHELKTSFPSPENLKRIFGELTSDLEKYAIGLKDVAVGFGEDFHHAGTRVYEAAARAKDGLNEAANGAANSVGPATEAADAYRDLAAAMARTGAGAKDFGNSADKALEFLQGLTKNARSAAKAAKEVEKANIEAAKAVILAKTLEAQSSNDAQAIANAEALNRELQKQIVYLGEIERGEIGLEETRRRTGPAAREAERALRDEFKATQLILELEKEKAQLSGQTYKAKVKEIEQLANKWKLLAGKIKDANEQLEAFALIQDITNEKILRASEDFIPGLIVAMEEYVKANTAASKAASLFNTTADAMTDAFTDMITGSKSAGEAFSNMATTIVNALARIAVEMLVVKPIVEALSLAFSSLGSGMGGGGIFGSLLGGMFGGMMGGMGGGVNLASATGSTIIGASVNPYFAKGGVMKSAGLSAYSNSIVNSPTFFPFAKGIGLMGEAGAEAVMPLERDSRGRLGVSIADGGAATAVTTIVQPKINIQVVNETGTPVQAEVQSSQGPDGGIDTIVRLIEQKMANNAKTGHSPYTSTMESLYGMSSTRRRRLRSG